MAIPFRKHAAGFERARHQPGDVEALADHDIGRCDCPVRVAHLGRECPGHVVRPAVVDDRACSTRVDADRSLDVIDPHEFERVLEHRLRCGHDCGDGFPDIADAILRKRVVRRRARSEIVGGPLLGDTVIEVRPQVAVAEHGHDSRQRERVGCIDRRNVCVRSGRAHEPDEARIRPGQIGQVARGTGEQRRILSTKHWLTHPHALPP